MMEETRAVAIESGLKIISALNWTCLRFVGLGLGLNIDQEIIK